MLCGVCADTSVPFASIGLVASDMRQSLESVTSQSQRHPNKLAMRCPFYPVTGSSPAARPFRSTPPTTSACASARSLEMNMKSYPINQDSS